MGALLIPGSYDPVTTGHMDVIARAAATGERIYAVIFINPDKSYRFPLAKRLAYLTEACRPYPNVTVMSDDGLVVDFAKRHGISFLLKGYRNAGDLAYEEDMARRNRTAGVETVLLPASPSHAHISSSEVRRRLDAGEPLTGYLPGEVIAMLEADTSNS